MPVAYGPYKMPLVTHACSSPAVTLHHLNTMGELGGYLKTDVSTSLLLPPKSLVVLQITV